MDDLKVEYFRRDLSPEEDAALAAQLDASDEAAVGFARLAEQDYQALGLPRPMWPRRDRRWPLLALLAVGLGAGAWLWQATASAPTRPAVLQAGTAPDLRVQEPEPAAQEPEAPAPVAPRPLPRLLVHAGAAGFAARLQPGVDEAPLLLVLDRQGRTLRRLAPNAQGEWVWDGQDGAQAPAAAGAYQLRVELGGRVLTQWVQVRRAYAP